MLPQHALLASVLAACGVIGVYAANVLLVAGPLAGPTLWGYATAGIVTAFVGLAMHSVLQHARVAAAVEGVGLHRLVAVVALATGGGLAGADAILYPQFYRPIHVGLEALALVAFAGAAHAFVRCSGIRTVAGAVGCAWAAMIACHGGATLADAVRTVVHHPTVHRRAWLALAAPPVLPALEGGCSANEVAGPELGTSDDVSAQELGTSDDAPRIIVLVTIDAFRCGFGSMDRPELREACPALTRILPSARYRLDAHATTPSTATSTRAMQTHGRASLGGTLQAKGFGTHVVVTHNRIVDDPFVRGGFEDVDEGLVPVAKSGIAPTSAPTTARVLATLQRAASDGRSHYVWAHYFDAHAPYIADADSPWKSAELDAYRVEVMRADAAVGALMEASRALPVPITFVITADHGEEFGEHRCSAHGGDLYEPATRVPVIVWSTTPGTRTPSRLPASSEEMGPYLLALALGREFHGSGTARLSAHADDDEQVGFVRDQYKLIVHRSLGYRELYDLGQDPDEAHDLTGVDPVRLRALDCGLRAAEAQNWK